MVRGLVFGELIYGQAFSEQLALYVTHKAHVGPGYQSSGFVLSILNIVYHVGDVAYI
jgi:hypothetical protein